MNQKRRETQAGALSALTLIGTAGLIVVIPIVAGVAGGAALDRRLGTRGIFTIIGAIFGIAGGLYGAWRLLLRATDGTAK